MDPYNCICEYIWSMRRLLTWVCRNFNYVMRVCVCMFGTVVYVRGSGVNTSLISINSQ